MKKIRRETRQGIFITIFGFLFFITGIVVGSGLIGMARLLCLLYFPKDRISKKQYIYISQQKWDKKTNLA